MGRARLPVIFIEREKSRKATFKKRTLGLKKKLFELSNLCRVNAAMISYDSESANAKAVIWPEDPEEFKSIIKTFQDKIAKQCPNNKYNLKAFLGDRKSKFVAETKKLKEKIHEFTHPPWHDSLNNLDNDSASSFFAALEGKIQGCRQRYAKGKAPAEAVATGSGTHMPQRQLSLAAPMVEQNPPPIGNETVELWSRFNPSYYDGMQFQSNNYYPAEPTSQDIPSQNIYHGMQFQVDPNPLPINNEMVHHWSGFNPSYYDDGMQFQNNNYYPAEPTLQDIPSQNIYHEMQFQVDPNPLPINNEMVHHWSGFNPSYHDDGMQFQNNNYYPTAAVEPALPNIPSQNINHGAADFQISQLQMQGLQPNSFYDMLSEDVIPNSFSDMLPEELQPNSFSDIYASR